MRRSVQATMVLDLRGRTELFAAFSAATGAALETESISFLLDGDELPVRELVDVHGTRLHTMVSGAGRLVAEYRAEVVGRAEPAASLEQDRITYLRPSRYCESDTLTPTARGEFAGLAGHTLLAAVTAWVGERLRYVPGSSQPTDGAEQTLLARRGVCRDYAHLVIALLRALDVPARMAAVYAPGLRPQDFHAVAEAWIDGVWWVVDATGLAPRASMLRIATGRDAADTAFLTNTRTDLRLLELRVTASADELPADDGAQLLALG